MGWAGNCGDGGVGGSSWYLVCETCRDKYLQAKKQSAAKRSSRKKTTIVPPTPVVKLSSPTADIPGICITVKSINMFLLNLRITRSG